MILRYLHTIKRAYIGQWINKELSMHLITKEIFSYYLHKHTWINDGNTENAIWFKLEKI